MALTGWAPQPSGGGFASREPPAAPDARRTYRMGKGWQAFLAAAAVGFAAAAVAAWRAIPSDGRPAQRIVPAAIFGGFALLAAIAVAGIRRMRVTIDEAGIAYVAWKKPRRMALDRVAGFRTLRAQHQVYLVFESRDPGEKKLKIPRMATMDAAFAAWLARIPDLDAADRARSEAELLRSSALGATPVERRANLRRARSLGRALTVGAIAAFVWALWYPRPYGWAVATAFAMPVVALGVMVVGRGLYQVAVGRNDARPQLLAPLLAPGLAGALRAFADVELLAPAQLVPPALAIGAAFGAAVLLAGRTPRREAGWMLLLVPWLAVQAGGALAIANCLDDPSPPVEFTADVLGKREEHGKLPSWNLQLGPWGPRTSPGEVKVSPRLFAAVKAGDRVIVRLRDGRLGMPWLRVAGRAP